MTSFLPLVTYLLGPRQILLIHVLAEKVLEPAPPPDMNAFDNFATQLVQRYCGTVKYYEPWNEPDNPQFWDGTDAQLLTIARHTYQIAKDPANCGCTNGVCSPNGGVNPNQVLLPPISGLGPGSIAWLNSYLASAGTSYPYADIAAFHGYQFDMDMLPRKSRQEYSFSNKPSANTVSPISRSGIPR